MLVWSCVPHLNMEQPCASAQSHVPVESGIWRPCHPTHGSGNLDAVAALIIVALGSAVAINTATASLLPNFQICGERCRPDDTAFWAGS